MNEIDNTLIKEIKNNKTPSVQYCFFTQDTILKSVQMGFADIYGQKKVDKNTTYNAFSITKTFTALAILQLSDRGKIDINKPVNQYLSEFPYGANITVKNLLTHTAGIPNPIPLAWIHLEIEHKTFDRDSFFQPVFDKNDKVKSKPNEKFKYSNLGYMVLGLLIEKVTGNTYEDYITENIIRRLPINPYDLAFVANNGEVHAKGYHKKMSFSNLLLGFFIDKSKFMGKTEGKWRSFNNYYVNGSPYGGLIGSPTSFVKYIQELLKEKSVLISEENKALLFQENKNNKGENTGLCLSWFSGELNGNKYFAHAGGGGGYYCEIRIYTEINKGSIIFFNRTGLSDERFLDKLDKYFINE
ncbi:serine hydrolase domain-containing protein [Confluentibacter flavum]|nr:serine hydrolase domain-containing protein [Confluentibacter flavum]